MSKTTNEVRLNLVWHRMLVPIWQQWASKSWSLMNMFWCVVLQCGSDASNLQQIWQGRQRNARPQGTAERHQAAGRPVLGRGHRRADGDTRQRPLGHRQLGGVHTGVHEQKTVDAARRAVRTQGSLSAESSILLHCLRHVYWLCVLFFCCVQFSVFFSGVERKVSRKAENKFGRCYYCTQTSCNSIQLLQDQLSRHFDGP